MILRGVLWSITLFGSSSGLHRGHYGLRMSSTKSTVASFVEKTLEANKSKFIARVYPINSPEEALNHVTQNKRDDPKASHWCWAFTHHGISRSSDDGEPSGTAGRPILNAIEAEELDSVAVVVTRYYGGTKLGKGGLVRAYGGSAREALRAAERVMRVECSEIVITLPPDSIAIVYRIISEIESKLCLDPTATCFRRISEEYSTDGQSVTMHWSVPSSSVKDIGASLKEATKGAGTVDTL